MLQMLNRTVASSKTHSPTGGAERRAARLRKAQAILEHVSRAKSAGAGTDITDLSDDALMTLLRRSKVRG